MIYELLLIRGNIYARNTGERGMGRYGLEIIYVTRYHYHGGLRQRYLRIGEDQQSRSSGVRRICSSSQLATLRSQNITIAAAYQTHLQLKARAVSYAFDMRDAGYLDHFKIREVCRRDMKEDEDDFEHLSPLQKMQALHDYQLDIPRDLFWDDRCEFLSVNLRLQRLEIDFEECYCPLGCCRMVDYVCEELQYPFREIPHRLDIIGWKDDAEKWMIQRRLTFSAAGSGIPAETIHLVETPGNQRKEKEQEFEGYG
jgi:hypothetical protein